MSAKVAGDRISVSQAAELCNVNRNTIGLWIRSGKLSANRVGRNYSIPREDLIFFLKSTGQTIPEELGQEHLSGTCFPTFQNCWQYHKFREGHTECEHCIIFKNQMKICFTRRDSKGIKCQQDCYSCQYYQKIYHPRMQFIEQIDSPAAICKDLHFWAANSNWEELCDLPRHSMVGMGIENIYHPDSLGNVISNIRKREMRDPWAPRVDRVFIQTETYKRLSVHIFVYPLTEPPGTWLLIGNPLDNRDGV